MCLTSILCRFLNPSKVVSVIKSAAGFKNLDFEFYDEKYTNGKLRLVLALLCGIIVGAVMSVSKLYGLAIPFALFGMVLVMYAPITGVYAAVFLAPFMPTMILAGICLWTALSLVIKSLSDENFKWKFDGVGMCILLLLGSIACIVTCIIRKNGKS